MVSKVSICIPSFNRKQHLLNTLKAIIVESHDIDFIDEIILIDDGYSSTDRDEIISEMQSYQKFRYHKSGSSGSFGDVYLECMKAAKTNYVLITYDDDVLFTQNLEKSLVARYDNDWSVVVPVWLSQKNRLLRGSKRKTHIIKPLKLLRYMAHAPGIIYNKDSCQNELKVLANRLSKDCLLSKMYPQVLLAALLIDGGKTIISSPNIIGKDGLGLPTEIKTPDGDDYFSLRARLNQYLSLIEIDDAQILNNDTIQNLRSEYFARILIEQSHNITVTAFLFYCKRTLTMQYRVCRHKLKNKLMRIFN